MSSNGASSNNSGTGNPDERDIVAGKAHFESVVEPLFQSKCNSCHNQPRFGGTATLAIFTYGDMASLMGNGDSATDNRLINIMQNVENHDGGDSCPQGITATPCREVVEWRQIERPFEDAGGLGAITFLSTTGDVSGWAMDPDDTSAKLTVLIYANGPAGTGTLIGTYQANEQGIGGIYGGHYFSFALPANLKNGQTHQLFIYADEATEENLLPGMPRSFEAYTPTAAGMAYFANTVRPSLNCNSCHVWDYTTAYRVLLTPTPARGGSASNNSFINFTAGENQHPGGNYCNGGKNSGVCSQLQTWWNMEF